MTRARSTLIESERKLTKHLEGLEAGIPASVIAPRISTAQREKDAAEAVLAYASPPPVPLTLGEVIETPSTLSDVPELLATIDQAERAQLYRALGVRVSYRRVGAVEQVRLHTEMTSVDLERVGGSGFSANAQVVAPRSVDLERVEGATCSNTTQHYSWSTALS